MRQISKRFSTWLSTCNIFVDFITHVQSALRPFHSAIHSSLTRVAGYCQSYSWASSFTRDGSETAFCVALYSWARLKRMPNLSQKYCRSEVSAIATGWQNEAFLFCADKNDCTVKNLTSSFMVLSATTWASLFSYAGVPSLMLGLFRCVVDCHNNAPATVGFLPVLCWIIKSTSVRRKR